MYEDGAFKSFQELKISIFFFYFPLSLTLLLEKALIMSFQWLDDVYLICNDILSPILASFDVIGKNV